MDGKQLLPAGLYFEVHRELELRKRTTEIQGNKIQTRHAL